MSGDSKDKPERPDRPGHPRGDGFGVRPPRIPGAGPGRAGSQGQIREGNRPAGPRRGRGRRARSAPAPIGGNDFELVHPPCVRETELDYEEGLEIWKAGDPEGARDALRYALAACRDNIWIHAALGRIALEEFRDPLARPRPFRLCGGAGEAALTPQFAGRLPAGPARQSAVLRRPRGIDPLAGRPRPERRFGGPPRAGGIGSARRVRDAVGIGPRNRSLRRRKKVRRGLTVFFDWMNFSDLRGTADRDRTAADRDPQAEGMARHSRPPDSCRRKGSRTSMRGGFATARAVVSSSRTAGAGRCLPRPIRLGAWV